MMMMMMMTEMDDDTVIEKNSLENFSHVQMFFLVCFKHKSLHEKVSQMGIPFICFKKI